MKILNEINESLKRIAAAQEKLAGIDYLTPLPKSKLNPEDISISTSSGPSKGDDIFSDISLEDQKKLEQELDFGRNSGLLFEEDAVSQELIERM